MSCPLCGADPIDSLGACPECLHGLHGDEGLAAATADGRAGVVALDRDGARAVRAGPDLVRGADAVVTEHAAARWSQRVGTGDAALCCALAWASGRPVGSHPWSADEVRLDPWTGCALLARNGYVVTVVKNGSRSGDADMVLEA